jgi:hypothetical protein
LSTASRQLPVDKSQLFYLFNLEKRIPERHLLRRINPTVTRILAGFRDKLEPFYSEIGRPSIDPELMIRMLIVGYCRVQLGTLTARERIPAAYSRRDNLIAAGGLMSYGTDVVDRYRRQGVHVSREKRSRASRACRRRCRVSRAG